MGWFRPTLPIDQDELEWQFATFKWLMERFGGVEFFAASPPIIPDAQHFPITATSASERASQCFDLVRDMAGMRDWPCRLEAGEDDRLPQIVPGIASTRASAPQPLGTYSVEPVQDSPAEVVIRYHPSLVDDPASLVATFAHELSHYLIHDFGEAPPGGWELDELATDLTAVYLGFGIFMANNAKQFDSFTSYDQIGWSSRRSGYLSEAALVTALAIRELLGGRDPLASSGPHLKSYLQADLKRASAWLRRNCPDLPATIDRIELADYMPAESR